MIRSRFPNVSGSIGSKCRADMNEPHQQALRESSRQTQFPGSNPHEPRGGESRLLGLSQGRIVKVADPHAGHKISEAHASHDRHAGHSVAMFRDKFWLSFALTIPVVFWSTDVQHWL